MMTKVTVISISGRGRNATVDLDTGESRLLRRDILKEHGLEKGSQLDTQALDKLTAESDRRRADDYAAYLLARQEYSAGLLRAKLTGKGYGSQLAGEIVRDLAARGLVDDRRFALLAVESLMRRKPAGRQYLIAYLRRKHIAAELASDTVDRILKDVDEVELAVGLLRRRWGQFSNLDLERRRAKAYNYLSRRAIGYGAARKAFEKLTDEETGN